MRGPQLSFLVGEAVNHVIGQMAINRVTGGAWEVEQVTRTEATRARVVFAVGHRAEHEPDRRPRVTVLIAGHDFDRPLPPDLT